ncbi:MAG TPA: AIR carboxylase family protein [Ardenticatenaceae bacterium]|jgi:5-(carboxyamino)imidazole ribonucleotide mutase/phosphoribosylaminoimidazole-succinocarboxamide synthase
MKVIILMGSPADRPFVEKITAALDRFELPYVTHVASAHKVPRQLLELVDRYEAEGGPRVYITVAGRSNALSGFVDAQVTAPVIACPPYSDSFGGADIWSSLRMPSGVAPAVVLEPANAALLAAKILRLEEQVAAAQQAARERLLDDDRRPTTNDR